DEFITLLKNGSITEDKIKPYFEMLREPIYLFLKDFEREEAWKSWEKPSEIIRIGEKIHYVIPATNKKNEPPFIFSFIVEDNQWYFHHMETIIIRLDKLTTFPTSQFPDVSMQKKHWILEEERWSTLVRTYNTLFQEVGKDFALNWFRDGVGYFMQAKTWVPLIEEEKAFILYVGWDLANRRGNETTLEKFDENDAIIRFKSQFFMLYHISGHLRNQISFKDYQTIFETIWLDRASKAGWNLNIKIDGDWVTFHFTK
ncbi:hypothetical protein ACFL6H_09495, partial [Candidatus Latescibacterota bacterium]